MPAFEELTRDENRVLSELGLIGLLSYGPEAVSAARTACDALILAQVDCESRLAAAAADALMAMQEGAAETIREALATLDDELARLVSHELAAARIRAEKDQAEKDQAENAAQDSSVP